VDIILNIGEFLLNYSLLVLSQVLKPLFFDLFRIGFVDLLIGFLLLVEGCWVVNGSIFYVLHKVVVESFHGLLKLRKAVALFFVSQTIVTLLADEFHVGKREINDRA
jgi:hypothetical protein